MIDGYDWNGLAEVDDKTIWNLKRTMRSELIAFTRTRLAESSAQPRPGDRLGRRASSTPTSITFGFARRVPSYKRLTLMLREPERLKALLTDQEAADPDRHRRQVAPRRRGRQGADPADGAVRRRRTTSGDRIVFLPDYDIGMAKPLYPGCDVWMNNPLRPYEACGTSGMKAALNGAANLSILDGWWDEWYDPAFGWEIPSAEGVDDADQRDDLEAKSLYDIIENEIVPRFYDRDSRRAAEALDPDDPRDRRRARPEGAGLADGARLRDPPLHAVGGVEPRRWRRRPAAPEALAEWKRQVRDAWGGVVVDHVQSLDGDQVEVGTGIHVSALVRLGSLSPERRRGAAGHRPGGFRRPAARAAGQPVPGRRRRRRRPAPLRGQVEARRAGAIGYTVRVVPHHPLLASTAEMGLAAVPSGMCSPPSA